MRRGIRHGPDQVRPYKLEGDTLTISGAPAKDTATGEEVVYRIAFQRVWSPPVACCPPRNRGL